MWIILYIVSLNRIDRLIVCVMIKIIYIINSSSTIAVINIIFVGTLSITLKSYRLLPLFPKSTYCLTPSIRKPNMDKRNSRIKLVLYLGTRWGALMFSAASDDIQSIGFNSRFGKNQCVKNLSVFNIDTFHRMF